MDLKEMAQRIYVLCGEDNIMNTHVRRGLLKIAEALDQQPYVSDDARDAARYRHIAEVFRGKRGIWDASYESDFKSDEEIDAEIAAQSSISHCDSSKEG